ncbi:MAG: hypothetical protein WBA76_10340, partial [Phormidesmis sp.]
MSNQFEVKMTNQPNRLTDEPTTSTGKRNVSEENSISVWKALKTSMACYFPAFILVGLSFLIFNFANRSSSIDQPTVSLTKEIEEKIKEEIDETLNNQLGNSAGTLSPQEAGSEAFRSALLKEYVDEKIRQEAQVQAERASSAEVNSLKADLKGDLFSQISFPVVFAVASIFAAFAVKDVLVEMLKDREKARLKQELRKELELYLDLVPTKITFENKRIVTALKQIEAYTYWLESKLLNTEIVKAINDIKVSSSNSQGERRSIATLEKLIDRSKVATDELSQSFEPS